MTLKNEVYTIFLYIPSTSRLYLLCVFYLAAGPFRVLSRAFTRFLSLQDNEFGSSKYIHTSKRSRIFSRLPTHLSWPLTSLFSLTPHGLTPRSATLAPCHSESLPLVPSSSLLTPLPSLLLVCLLSSSFSSLPMIALHYRRCSSHSYSLVTLLSS